LNPRYLIHARMNFTGDPVLNGTGFVFITNLYCFLLSDYPT
jgi:hypothetical protein